MRFYWGGFAVSGDIEQFFHHIKLRKLIETLYVFVWRESPDKTTSGHQVATHLLGKTDLPRC